MPAPVESAPFNFPTPSAMNRIYQGRVTRVEILQPGKKGTKPEDWQPFVPGDSKEARAADRHAWQSAVWHHHELFQDAVNYYSLALAAMAVGIEGESAEAKAMRSWATKVRETWNTATRKAATFNGPRKRLATVLGLDPAQACFDTAIEQVLHGCPASPLVRGNGFLRLLELANEASDLSAFAVEKLAWLCDPDTKRKTDDSAKLVKRQAAQRFARHLQECATDELSDLAVEFSPSLFVQSAKFASGREAKNCLTEYFDVARERAPELSTHRDRWIAYVLSLDPKLLVEVAAKRYQGVFPFAVLFKHWPGVKVIAAAFKRATERLATGKDVEGLIRDPLRELRTAADLKAFDYFTNLALIRNPGYRERAAWFEFDLAAFVEAIKSPHRYFQDSLKREDEAQRLRREISAMEGKGREVSAADETEESVPGFDGDDRIKLLERIVQEKLAWLAEGDGPVAEAKEYTIRERTVRGFSEIKRRWRSAAEAYRATEAQLMKILADEQSVHRDDFGSATFYGWLAKPEFHPIWRDPGSQPWHADDPLDAWLDYKELLAELADKTRPIRFTPAHSSQSPRFFIFPKKSEKESRQNGKRASRPGRSSQHDAGQLSFTAAIVRTTTQGKEPTIVRIHYSAPRLHRDRLREEGDTNLHAAPWIQPMMEALGMVESPARVNFANCRITLQPQNERYIQLTFPVEVATEAVQAAVSRSAVWDKQFNLHPDGEDFYNASLRWPHEKQPTKAPKPWHESTFDFCCLSADLGQRDAGAFARLVVRCDGDLANCPSRFIGTTGTKHWRAALDRSGLFRLSGEDAMVWRALSSRDAENPEDFGKSFDFREELWGERGRPARVWESDDTADLMRLLEAVEKDVNEKENFLLLPDGWRSRLSFPEQNDKLLVAMRRFQSRIARLHRWCWFLRGDDRQQSTAREEIAECDDPRLVSPDLKALIEKRDLRALDTLDCLLRERLTCAPSLLVRVANRVLPLHGRSWRWGKHLAATDQNPLHVLTQDGPIMDSKDRPVWLRGQRGLSMERIEQIEELRKRFQSLNQTLRHAIGSKPPIRRDESVPDPCPDLLDKLDHLKEQRINQTAHLILAEALGLRLAPPPSNKQALRQEKDQHGVYEKICDDKGDWIGPVDFIVIEDLSRYRASQGRAPRENSRLMKWSHRAVRDKLKQLCEVFGLPVLETPAAYSSRFCSRSGVPGFRAEDVAAGFTQSGHWAWLAGKKNGWKPDRGSTAPRRA